MIERDLMIMMMIYTFILNNPLEELIVDVLGRLTEQNIFSLSPKLFF